jgi:ribosome-associated protein
MSDDDFISKTQRKKQMHELQGVGAALVRLSAERLARIRMPEALRDAIVAAQGITKHEARRRQLQYIGRLMRDIDAAPIAAQLAELEAPSKRQSALFHVAERWRPELIDDPAAFERFVKDFPGADEKRLRDLLHAARAERGAGRQTRAFRELFHEVNTLVQERAGRGSPTGWGDST